MENHSKNLQIQLRIWELSTGSHHFWNENRKEGVLGTKIKSTITDEYLSDASLKVTVNPLKVTCFSNEST